MDPGLLGRRIRQLRTACGLGLRQLARRAETSAASLVAIEKGQTSPTLATLNKILKGLNTDFATFFAAAAAPSEVPVFRPADMQTIEDGLREYTLVFPRRDSLRFEMLQETISPVEKEPEWECHAFDVGGLIVSGGPASLEIDGQGRWTLKRGHAFYVEAGKRHRVRNEGQRPLRMITAVSPARY
jgi:transcriptional regulator with XRE-family HTH domain